MMSARGYSLWFMPSGKDYRFLKRRIDELSGRYNEPSFEPHVTLLGEMEGKESDLIKKTNILASRISPFTICLTKFSYGSSYFQCLFYLARKSIKLMNANKEAKAIFQVPSNLYYSPHLSLLYSNSVDSESLAKNFPKKISINFSANSIYLINANGAPNEWKRLKEFSFK